MGHRNVPPELAPIGIDLEENTSAKTSKIADHKKQKRV
jgi:hypothetical protein